MNRLTREQAELFSNRETMLDRVELHCIDSAMNFLQAAMETAGLRTAGDDRAARLEAEIIRYVIDSRR